MNIFDTPLEGVKLVKLKVHGDARGFFVERFNADSFREAGFTQNFVQDNHSRSAPSILRGLHYQHNPAQGKLVGVVRGRVWDVAVDIRKHSPTFGQHYGTELSDAGELLWIPPGFAHGFCVMGNEPADVYYKVTEIYHPAGEGGIAYNDAELNISWPLNEPIISARDQALSSFADYKKAPLW